MDCPEENVVVDFARGELPKADRAAIEAHLDTCAACSQLVAEMARIFADDNASAGTDEPAALPSSALTLGTEGAFSPTRQTREGSRREPERLLPQGSKLGRYVVIGRIGAGGMGVVYAAYDPELDRKVALKVLRSEKVGRSGKQEDQRTRLIREAQAMAKLSHKNVITVHDVGTFEDQVFIAMEFIDGGTLGQWLAKEPRPRRDILRVFRGAGEGLFAAHEVGLVHRDFKPDNVLMGTDGRVLVTDFGLARPAAGNTGRFHSLGDASSSTGLLHASLTQTGALVGTPAYMAPEQLHGRATNALSDQFSFCVALYEALYGERPFEGQALVELVHNVTEGNLRPPPRDARVPRWLRRAVLRGLEIEPSARYETMDALLLAVRRDPWLYWRRWGAVTIPTAVLAVGIVAYQADRGDAQYCDDADSSGVWNTAARDAITTAFMATELSYAPHALASTVSALDAYAQTWDTLQSEACRDQAGGEQPQAVLALRIGCLERRLDGLRTMVDEFQRGDAATVNGALPAIAMLPAPQACTDLQALAERIEVLETAEARELATAVDQTGVRAGARLAAAKHTEALSLAENMIERAAAVSYSRGEADGLNIMGRALYSLGRYEDAESAYHRTLSASLAAGHPEAMAKASVGLVQIAATLERPADEAERWAAHGLAALEQLGGHARIEAELYLAIAHARRRAGDLDSASAALRRALDVVEPDPASAQLRAWLQIERGRVLLAKRRADEALSVFEQAGETLRDAFGQTHPNVAAALDLRGQALLHLGRHQEALVQQQRALQIRTAAGGSAHAEIAAAQKSISATMVAIGDLDSALDHAQLGVAAARKSEATEAAVLIDAIEQLALVMSARGDHAGAAAVLRDALRIALAGNGRAKPRQFDVRAALARALQRSGDVAEARDLLVTLVPTLVEREGADAPRVGEMTRRLAEVQLASGSHEEAERLATEAIRIAVTNVDPAQAARARFILAQSLAKTPDRHEKALSLAQKAHDYFTEADPDRAVRVAAWMVEHKASAPP